MRLTDVFLDLLFPSHCSACQDRIPAGSDWCEACAATLIEGTSAACPICGLIWLEPPPGGAHHVCGDCIRHRPPFRRAIAAFAYGGAMQEAIRRWKNAPDEGLGRPLVSAMLRELQKVGAKDALVTAAGHGCDPVANPPVVVPIPSRFASLKVRAFNPAAALAWGVAKAMKLPYRPSTLSFVGSLPSSRGLGRRERAERMVGVMRAESRYVTGRHVLIVDDVITTGATVAEAARACLEAGAQTVTVVALARVPGS